MAKLSIVAGATSQTVNVFIQDSSSTTGAGLTGLAFNTASLTAYYILPKAAAVSITLATQTVTGAYSSGGFVEISSANTPGWYRLDLPDAALASGRFVSLHLKGATNMAPCPVEIELTGWNNQDAVHGGMTALPNATAGATNGLPLAVDSSGRVDVLKVNGTSQTAKDLGASATQTGDSYARLGAPAGVSVSADVAALPTANGNADALLDRTNGVETSWTLRQVLRVIFAALAGKADGAATTTMHFRDQADTKNRITATVDASGNRTALTLDAS